MKRAFCTLFDARYLSRALALYESLERHARDFVLYLFPFDEPARAALARLALPHAVVVPLAEFEDAELLRAKAGRSPLEYFFTCTPSTILHVLDRFGAESCTYLDADTYFLGSPERLFDEMGADDVMLTEHRYAPRYDQSARSGIYCVQFMPFRDTPNGRAILRWWRNACLESCELNPDAGKFGDQSYLNDWPARFGGVHVLEHPGGGLAPWNLARYAFERGAGGAWTGFEASTGRRFAPVFFHFHALRLWTSGRLQLTHAMYEVSEPALRLFYAPYVRHLDDVGRRLAALGIGFDPHGRTEEPRRRLRERAALLLQRAREAAGLAVPNRNRVYELDELLRLDAGSGAPAGGAAP